MLALAAEAHELLASRLTVEARAFSRGAPEIAERASRTAWGMRPFDTTIAHGRVQVLVQRSRSDPAALREAESIARRALAIEPERNECEHFLAMVLAQRALRGEVPVDSMAAHYEAALALAPMDALIRMECATYALMLGQPRLAASAAMDAAALYPNEAAPWALVARARAAMRDLEGARDALRHALAGEWRGDAVGRARAQRGWAIVEAESMRTVQTR